MRAVLYTPDMIPITVMKLEPWMVKFLHENGSFYLAVHEPFKFKYEPESQCRTMTVRITAERLVRRRQETFMLFTQDEESALLIEAAFLPGQQRQLNEVKEREFARGFFAGIMFR